MQYTSVSRENSDKKMVPMSNNPNPNRAEGNQVKPSERQGSSTPPPDLGRQGSTTTETIYDEAIRIVRKVGSTYFGDSEPKQLNFVARFLAALTGVVVFGVSVLPGQIPRILNKFIDSAGHLTRIASTDNNPALLNKIQTSRLNRHHFENEVDWAVYKFYLNMVNNATEIGYVAICVFCVAMALVIASGIKYGGPLRLFFAGVVIPAAVMFITRSAI